MPYVLSERNYRELVEVINSHRRKFTNLERKVAGSRRHYGTVRSADSSRIVQIHTGGTAGDLVSPTSGVFPGRIRFLKQNVWTTGRSVWIGYTDWESDAGAVVGENGRSFVGTRGGLYTVSGVKRPLYHVTAGEMSFVCKADSDIAMGASGTVSLYHGTTPSDSTLDLTAKALGAAVTGSKWAVCARLRSGQIYVSPWEC